ncbi:MULTISPECIES: DUF1127 domain-containing protein [unclassified Bradyrhizobium]|uniref:DUF1127 domain-containing protein n=1 Tax=unclassified Bradyrhizobium TaxID=2631580 RepID=UPI000A039987|nr:MULTISPECIES: hypothetical protein [unclassified Bradyrhizobium]QIG91024.1 DUF1127 domain-containing protein [Bradyrhizobium sp. 6(2017)]
MSALITDPLSLPSNPADDPPTRLHQFDFGPGPAIGWHGWSGWAARRSLRGALRELAEDKHLLADIGLTREQALEEAAKPFWR